ncbi:virion structural protein [Pseudomonas phage PhiPA3]|uniref:Uncharacterized protein 082 n=1 Tax=Pseudomonas phage PhiPA3 TaxID=998086 RepID=F8SJW1_BPPA3|nr:virion structural protein [Pseudomonas phage PhiPA3]AEH03506.1 hypothetical protein [Pseudomonas phage PhiPA3]
MTAGTLQNDTTPWMKFAYNNKALFIAQKSIRYGMSWDSLNAAAVATPGKTITIGNYRYKCRLLLIAPADSGNSNSTLPGREWSNLIYNVCTAGPSTKGWAAFTTADLGIGGSFNGRYNWGQESGTATSGAGRAGVGYTTINKLDFNASGNTGTHMGWRPCLELVGKIA